MPTKFIYDKSLKEQQQLVDEILKLVDTNPFQNTNTNILATFIDSMFQVNFNKRRQQYEEYKKQLEEQKRLEAEILKRKRQISQMRALEMAPRPSYAGAYEILRSKKKKQPKFQPAEPLEPTAVPPKAPEIKPLEPQQTPIKKVPLENIPVPPPPTPEGENILPEGTIKTNKPLPPGPPPKEKEEYTINFAGRPIGIVIDTDDQGILTYTLIEPQVDEALLATTLRLFGKNQERINDKEYLSRIVEKAAKRMNEIYNPNTVKKIRYHLKKKFGFGRIEPLMHDNKVEEIKVENNQVKVKQVNFNEELNTNITYEDSETIRKRLKKIAKLIGAEISDKNQVVDKIYNGFKVHMEWGSDTTEPKLELKRLEE